MSDINKDLDLNKLAEQLVNLKVLQINELATILKDQYGIEPASVAPVVVADTKAENQEAKEKTSFNLILKSVGTAKLKVIKAIKEITGLGLKESKELADNLPSTIKKDLKKADADNMKNLLEEAGAEVVLE